MGDTISIHQPRRFSLPSERSKFEELFAEADVRVNGSRPWDIRVHDDRLYERVLTEGSLGLGEAYMDFWWDVDALDEFSTRVRRAELEKKTKSLTLALLALKGRVLNRQGIADSKQVAKKHYDIGNDLFEIMLDRQMQYTCGYWKNAITLDEAQDDKLHLVCKKLTLEPGMRVLELGGGFGGLAHVMAAKHKCEVVSYNISEAQVDYGRRLCGGLPVRFEQKDYRESIREQGPFDRVVSVGLCEHIGQKNYATFFDLIHRMLGPKGLALVHTIGGNRSYSCTDAWLDKYIFPNGLIPSILQLSKAMEGLWVVEDWHNFGPDYDKTLMAWWSNFERGWNQLQAKYGDRFYRMWRYYIQGAAGSFRARQLQLWQIVLSKGDIASYAPVR